MFKTTATKLAHNPTFSSISGNKDLRPLQDLITAEKAVIMSLQKSCTDFTKASEALRTWGLGEGEDLGDILSGSTTILSLFTAAIAQFSSHELTIRDHMKSIRTYEEKLDELKKQRKSLGAKTDAAEKKLSKMGPENKNISQQTDLLASLRDQIRSMDSEIMTEEAALGDFKRKATREFMSLKFGGILELSEKGTIVGELGKLVTAEIPQDVTQPGTARNFYNGHGKTEGLVAEAQRCVGGVAYTATPSANPSLTRVQSNQQQHQQPSASFDQPNAEQHQGRPSDWSAGGAENGNGPTNFGAPSGEGQGLGHFIDPSEAPSTQTNFDSETGTGGGGTSRQASQAYSVDEMGISPSSRPGVEFGGGGGGRFATFPVKNVGKGPSTVRDEPPSLGSGLGRARSSFEASVNQALGESSDPTPGTMGNFGGGGDVRTNFDVEYNQMNRSTYAPPPGPPPGVSVSPGGPPPYGTGPSIGAPQTHRPALSYGSGTGLDNPWSESGSSHQKTDSEDSAHLPYSGPEEAGAGSSRHVRFGEDNGEDESQTPTVADPQHRGREPNFQSHRIPPPQLTPPPPISPEEEERERNAAAARDVSRELDALSFAPADNRAPSPLLPPAPHFSRRAVSPRPTLTTVVPTLPQPTSEIPSPQNRSPAASSPTLSLSLSERNGGTPPTVPSIGLQAPGRSLPGTASPLSNPYRGANTSQGLGPAQNKSTSSLNMPSPPLPAGTRTISAAAFKRPKATSNLSSAPGPGVGIEGALADTSPLMFKKKTLPSSPYPQRAPEGPAPGDSRLDPPETQRRNSALQDRLSRNLEGEESFDYIAAYVNDGSPVDEESREYGQVGVPNEGRSPAPGQGYGQGRFATNLDDGLR